MRLDEKKREAGAVFPPHHQVRAKLLEIEIGFVEGVICRIVQILVNLKSSGVGVVLNLDGKNMEAAGVAIGARRSDALVLRVLAGGDKGLAVILQGEIRRAAVIQTQCNAQSFLIQSPENVKILLRHIVNRRVNILQVIFVVVVKWAHAKFECIEWAVNDL